MIIVSEKYGCLEYRIGMGKGVVRRAVHKCSRVMLMLIDR